MDIKNSGPDPRANPQLCIAPWTHLHVATDGSVLPCCVAHHKLPVGNVKKSSLEQVWNSEEMKSLRKRMLQGKSSRECRNCDLFEEVGMASNRNALNSRFADHFPLVGQTREDGHVEKVNLAYLDVRFSNLCNLRCRSCNFEFSSGWYEDDTRMGGRKHTEIYKPFKDVAELKQRVEPYLDSLEEIYFAGGEPLINDQHYYILNRLIEKKRRSVRLIYSTNFSTLKFKDQHVFDLWKHFDHVQVNASLDGMHGRAEFIRKGQSWRKTVQNRRDMIERVPGVIFDVTCTLSVLNALHAPDFHREWVELGLIRPQNFRLNPVIEPREYQMTILPPQLKERVREKYERHIEEFLRPFGENTAKSVSEYRSAIEFMNKKSSWSARREFVRVTRRLDAIRNEDFRAQFPELEFLLAPFYEKIYRNIFKTV